MYSSLYPSILREFNIASNTQIGMLIIPKKVHDKENRHKMDKWTRSMAFMEDFQSQVWLEICSRWFGLADYTELYHEVIAFFENIMNAANGLRTFDREGYIIPMTFFNKDSNFIEPMEFYNERHVTERYIPRDYNRWEAWRNHAIEIPNQQF
jgi:hypothetical protein